MLCYAKSLQLCPTLCDPIDGSHQAPPSLGFSRQEHWSGLPFPSPMHESESEVAQSCPTLSDPMDCSPPGSSVHGIFQARVLEWVAIAFSVTIAYTAVITTHRKISSLLSCQLAPSLPTPVFLPGESQGQESLVGCRLSA